MNRRFWLFDRYVNFRAVEISTFMHGFPGTKKLPPPGRVNTPHSRLRAQVVAALRGADGYVSMHEFTS